jgi:uncharacterized protein YdhG (YjbR/CyaY superfamily)
VEVGAKKDCMVIAFASDTPHVEWKPSKIVQTSKNRVVHYFEVTDDGRFPEFIGRISQAYALTKSNRPRRDASEKGTYATIDEYIALFPADIQKILTEIRATIRRSALDAVEKISWQMPTFHQKENLIHFAAAKNHIGIYPGAEAMEVFASELSDYKTSKGAIQLPLSKPIPYELIARIVRFRVDAVRDLQ